MCHAPFPECSQKHLRDLLSSRYEAMPRPGAYVMPRYNFVLFRASTYEDCAPVLRLTGCGTVARTGFVSHLPSLKRTGHLVLPLGSGRGLPAGPTGPPRKGTYADYVRTFSKISPTSLVTVWLRCIEYGNGRIR
jgi:hypothetical protein